MNGQPLLSNITHEPHGPVSGWSWPSGLAHVRAHGLDGEVQRIESAVAATYAYDPAGRMTGQHLWSQLTPPQADTVNSYGYDAAGRLTQASTSGPYAATQAYAYDANGNRTSLIQDWSQAAYAYSANRLTQLSGTFSQVFQYDGAGRLISDGFFGYAYDALGRLSSVSGRAGAVASYRYNALGQRVAKDTFAGNTRFVYDEGGHLMGEYDSQGKLVQEIVWLDDLPVASMRPNSSGVGVDIFYIHPDHLGTPQQITDNTNRILWRWDNIEPFGAYGPDWDPDRDYVRFEFNLRFPGQYFDMETGRHYNYFRDYDPATGRYVQSDPIGLEGGINRYAYVNGNPISKIDPLGLMGATGTWSTGTSGSWGPYPNGNVSPEYIEQDWICSSPAGIFNGFACTKQCCVEHDECYKKNRCNQSSWGGPLSSACQQCNTAVVKCITSGSPKRGCGQGCSSTFNGAP